MARANTLCRPRICPKGKSPTRQSNDPRSRQSAFSSVPKTTIHPLSTPGVSATARRDIVTENLTTVEILWLEKRIENRVRFGRPVSEQVVDRNRRRSVLCARQHLRLRALDIQRLRNGPIPHRHLARSDTRTTLFDGALDQSRRGHSCCACPAGQRSNGCCN